MSTRLSLQLLVFASEILGEITSAGVKAVWSRWIDHGRFNRKLDRFAELGWIKQHRLGGNTDRIVRLTEVGRAIALGGRDPEERWSRSWDGCWRIVVFDVPESESNLRTKLRRKLRARGFGFLQQSVWVSPDPVAALRHLLEGDSVDVQRLSFLEARPCGGEDDLDIVSGSWDFVRINRGYQLYLELLDAFPSHQGREAQQAWFRAESKAWSAAFEADPLLPSDLLPPGYMGKIAWARRVAFLRALVRPE